MKVSIVILCFNARYVIHRLVSAARRAPISDCEIIVVDDGSNDGTRTVLKTDVEAMVDRVIYHGLNRGKGAALRDGFAAATGDVILVHDADFECAASEYVRLVEPIATGKADVVFGSRVIGGRARGARSSSRMAGNRMLTLFSNICTHISISDLQTGCKAFRASVIKNLELCEDRFGTEPETTAKLARTGRRIFEVSISCHARPPEPEKRVSCRDTIRAFYAVIKYNFFAPIRKPAGIIRRPTRSEDTLPLPTAVKHS